MVQLDVPYNPIQLDSVPTASCACRRPRNPKCRRLISPPPVYSGRPRCWFRSAPPHSRSPPRAPPRTPPIAAPSRFPRGTLTPSLDMGTEDNATIPARPPRGLPGTPQLDSPLPGQPRRPLICRLAVMLLCCSGGDDCCGYEDYLRLRCSHRAILEAL